MNIKSSEKKEKNVVDLIVEVNPEEFDSAIDEAFKKNKNSIAVPGFRKGKAPRKIIERMYGASVFYNDALDVIAPKAIAFVAVESDLKIVGFPQVTDVDIKEEDGGLDLTVSVAVYPEVTLGEYKGLSAVKPAVVVADSEIDSEIAGIRLRNARIEKADRPAINNDTVIIDYEGFLDGVPFDGGKGENHELELGSNTFIPGFEEKIQGMSVGEERDIDLVFPENYTEELAGKPVVFKVKMIEVREKILPDLDDEFAKDVSEFDTLEEYKQSIRDGIIKIRQSDADAAFENALVEKIIDSMEADVPDAMIDEQLQSALNNFVNQTSAYGMDPNMYLQMMNETPDSFRDKMRVSSEKQVRGMLALEKIAELENVSVSEEDIENEYNSLVERYGMELDQVKENMSEDVVVREIKLKHAAKIVTDNATAEEPPEQDEADDSEEPGESGTGEISSAPVTAEKAKKTAAKKPASQKTKQNAVDATAATDTTESAGTENQDSASQRSADQAGAAQENAPSDSVQPDYAPDTDIGQTTKPAVKKTASKKSKAEASSAESGSAGAEENTGGESSPEKEPAARKPRKQKAEEAN